ncbi:MAG: hypothetical protein HQL01_09530 [Nitrospirae bacterium]|nr:hypothetical protein [Nitrospirota bacterium]
MIVPMKKITIIAGTSQLDSLLATLRETGVLHIINITTKDNELTGNLRENILAMKKALSIITQRDLLPEDPIASVCEDALSVSRRIISGVDHLKQMKIVAAQMENEYERFSVWGDFDNRAIEELQKSGLYVTLFKCTQREYDEKTRGLCTYVIRKIKNFVYFAAVSTEKDLRLPFEAIQPAGHNPGDILMELNETKRQINELEKGISILSQKRGIIEKTLLEYEDALNYELAKEGVANEGVISYLSGFCPSSDVEKLRNAVKKNHWAIIEEDPKEDDPVPTIQQNTVPASYAGPLMRFIGVAPGYREFDTNWIFLIFFSIFFAMIMGDAGYGLIMLMGVYLLKKLAKKNIPAETASLFYVLSISTAVWGAITGSWFSVERFNSLPVIRALIVPLLDSFSKSGEISVIRLCFILGGIHLTAAHLWKAARAYPRLSALAEIGFTILIWSLYHIITYLLLNEPLSSIIPALIISAVTLIIVFGEQMDDGLGRGVLRGIKNLPQNILAGIGSFSDLMSYIRLFAVGSASRQLALAFNDLGGTGNAISGTLILVAGHTVNIVLGAMSVLVHGVRLNLLEFSGHLGIQWSGIAYNPFKRISVEEADERG